MMVNEEPFGFELFAGQKKQFEDGTALGFGKLWPAVYTLFGDYVD